uniref:SCP domain-containing protein n=1 Tax=Callorhinchus milii TaxID=7868 RepID=A0A4W3HCT4_CALMI
MSDSLMTLIAHNDYRKIHKATELVFDQELRDQCKTWADAIAATGTIEDSASKNGENIWFKPNATEVLGKEPVDSWYEEINDYDFSSPGFSSLTSKFTQLIWKETTHMGISYSVGEAGLFVVAQYRPAGNSKNPRVFASNVLSETKTPLEILGSTSESLSDQNVPLDITGTKPC